MNVRDIQKKKEKGRKIVALTAYDHYTSVCANKVGIDIILVGDSLGMVVLGYEDTLQVTMEDMLIHCRAVERGNSSAFLVADMPFMSYQVSPRIAVKNAGRFIKEAHMHAVKLEGGRSVGRKVSAILDAGIPVMGHLGVLPQSIHKAGGYHVRGGKKKEFNEIIEDALYLESLGVFSIVLECVHAVLAAEVTKVLRIPTIGIGAGNKCDGQILVCHDILGIGTKKAPRFVKKYAHVGDDIQKAFKKYKKDVVSGKFPAKKHSY